MKFNTQLNNYIKQLNCTLEELSLNSNISLTTINSYQDGTKKPAKESKELNKLVNGILKIANFKKITNITKDTIIKNLSNSLSDFTIDFNILSSNFDKLISILNINMAEMARFLNFDASYLSRIRNGKRHPTNTEVFINNICSYIVKKYSDDTSKKTIANLICCPYEDLITSENYLLTLKNWISSDSKETNTSIQKFLQNLDVFNLNEYIRIIHFDDIKVPHIPFALPTSKNYYGINEMKEGELDFFKATILSKSSNTIFMCNDMPMEDIANDKEFGKKWMYAIAVAIKKGIHINIIHNINRPFNELFLGLESWIPLYMTGQISPYYLQGIQNNIYNHLTYVSDTISLSGECITGAHDKGKYYLTNNKGEIKYYKEKASCLLNKSKSLMDIYTKDNKNVFMAFLKSNAHLSGKRHSILSSLPIFTISNDLLIEILNNNSIPKSDQEEIISFVSKQKILIDNILQKDTIFDECTKLSKEEFEKYPMTLSLSRIFYKKQIFYTYEEYLKHLEEIKNFMKKYKNYKYKDLTKNPFRNIQVYIYENNWAMISKNTNPTIHFIIRNTKLLSAIESFIAPIEDY